MDWFSLIDFYLFLFVNLLVSRSALNLFVVVWVEHCNNWSDSTSVDEAGFLSFIQKNKPRQPIHIHLWLSTRKHLALVYQHKERQNSCQFLSKNQSSTSQCLLQNFRSCSKNASSQPAKHSRGACPFYVRLCYAWTQHPNFAWYMYTVYTIWARCAIPDTFYTQPNMQASSYAFRMALHERIRS